MLQHSFKKEDSVYSILEYNGSVKYENNINFKTRFCFHFHDLSVSM